MPCGACELRLRISQPATSVFDQGGCCGPSAGPVPVVAREAVVPLVVADRGLGDRGRAGRSAGGTSAGNPRGAGLVDVAEVEEAVGLPRRTSAATRSARWPGVATSPAAHTTARCPCPARAPAGASRARGQPIVSATASLSWEHEQAVAHAALPPGRRGGSRPRRARSWCVEPPPSRLSASRAPSERISRAASGERHADAPAGPPAVHRHEQERAVRPARPRACAAGGPATKVPKKAGACGGAKPSAAAVTATRPARSSRGPPPTTSVRCCQVHRPARRPCSVSCDLRAAARQRDVAQEAGGVARAGQEQRRRAARARCPAPRTLATVRRGGRPPPRPLGAAGRRSAARAARARWRRVHVSTAFGRVVGMSPPRPPQAGIRPRVRSTPSICRVTPVDR